MNQYHKKNQEEINYSSDDSGLIEEQIHYKINTTETNKDFDENWNNYSDNDEYIEPVDVKKNDQDDTKKNFSDNKFNKKFTKGNYKNNYNHHNRNDYFKKKNYDSTYKTWNHDKNFDLVDDELCKEVEKIEESNYTKDDNNKEKYSYNYYKGSGQVYQNNVKKVFKNTKRYYNDNTQNDQQQFRNNYNQDGNGYKNYNKSNFKNKDNFEKNYKQNNHYYNDYSQDNQHGKKQRDFKKNNFKTNKPNEVKVEKTEAPQSEQATSVTENLNKEIQTNTPISINKPVTTPAENLIQKAIPSHNFPPKFTENINTNVYPRPVNNFQQFPSQISQYYNNNNIYFNNNINYLAPVNNNNPQFNYGQVQLNPQMMVFPGNNVNNDIINVTEITKKLNINADEFVPKNKEPKKNELNKFDFYHNQLQMSQKKF